MSYLEIFPNYIIAFKQIFDDSTDTYMYVNVFMVKDP